MKIKGIVILACLLLSGCELTEAFSVPVEEVEPEKTADVAQHICVFKEQAHQSEHNCELVYWLTFWAFEGGKPWPERKSMIANLGETQPQMLKKVLLSQGKETPYQVRLRAQNWTSQIMPELTDTMANIVTVLIKDSSQERLEFESALAILTRLNAEQSKTLEEQNLKLEEQRQQLEKLLKIEASMMEKRGGIDQ